MEKKKDPYMQEAYDMLEQMSADERKRLEYEAREKAIRDTIRRCIVCESKG